jgi:NAD-dependent SIR2 family protein deacetylase
MPSRFASGKYTIAQCDRCGFRFKLVKLKSLTIKTKNVNILVCPECWEPDHPQLKIGMYPISDPQAIRNPRADTSYAESRSYTEPLYVGAGISFSVGVLTDVISNPGSYFSGGMFSGGMFASKYF